MKQFYSFLLLLMTSSFAFATIRTVSNVPSTLAQFNTIQAAIDASTSGDTVYVHGSPNQYAAFTINSKKITVIGPGFSPNKNLPLTASVAGFTVTGDASSGSEFQGLVVTGALIIIQQNKADNIRFIRNQFAASVIVINAGGTTYSGYLFEGNYFENSQVTASTSSTYTNFLFQNNLFYENGCCIDANINGFTNSVNVLFNHNLWYGGNPNNLRNLFSGNCRFIQLTNNVIVGRNPINNLTSATFTNNITFNCSDNKPWASIVNVDGGGNIENKDPQMAAQASVNAAANNPTLDFSIAAGPANNSASDGKDMGLLFDATGSLNWNNSRLSRLPFINVMNIVNPTIPQAGTLEVKVEAKKNN